MGNLEAMLEELRTQRGKIDDAIAALQAMHNGNMVQERETKPKPKRQYTTKRVIHRGASDKVRELLRSSGRPVHKADIGQRLLEHYEGVRGARRKENLISLVVAGLVRNGEIKESAAPGFYEPTPRMKMTAAGKV